jgi:hypothetical protein
MGRNAKMEIAQAVSNNGHSRRTVKAVAMGLSASISHVRGNDVISNPTPISS